MKRVPLEDLKKGKRISRFYSLVQIDYQSGEAIYVPTILLPFYRLRKRRRRKVWEAYLQGYYDGYLEACKKIWSLEAKWGREDEGKEERRENS